MDGLHASRYVPVIEAMTQEREVDMLTVMVRAVRQHGPPGARYLDNGRECRLHRARCRRRAAA